MMCFFVWIYILMYYFRTEKKAVFIIFNHKTCISKNKYLILWYKNREHDIFNRHTMVEQLEIDIQFVSMTTFCPLSFG